MEELRKGTCTSGESRKSTLAFIDILCSDEPALSTLSEAVGGRDDSGMSPESKRSSWGDEVMQSSAEGYVASVELPTDVDFDDFVRSVAISGIGSFLSF